MALLKHARSPNARIDDLSDSNHRRLIGILGLALPVVLVALDAVRPDSPLNPAAVRDSISAYYYTGAVAAFVGLLVSLALFLFSYEGYRNSRGRLDRRTAVTSACAALGVAFFPTTPPAGVTIYWWAKWVLWIHYGSAVVLFSCFAVFSLFLFRTKATGEPTSPDKMWRNRFFFGCGVLIVTGMVWAGIAGLRRMPIFLPEALALEAFALSWLVKGYAHSTLWAWFKRLFSIALPTAR